MVVEIISTYLIIGLAYSFAVWTTRPRDEWLRHQRRFGSTVSRLHSAEDQKRIKRIIKLTKVIFHAAIVADFLLRAIAWPYYLVGVDWR